MSNSSFCIPILSCVQSHQNNHIIGLTTEHIQKAAAFRNTIIMQSPEKLLLPSSFESQRDYLVQEIATALDSVVYNLETLNRTLNDSVQVGKEFENAGQLWSTFYNGLQTQRDLGVLEAEKEVEGLEGRSPK